jgi:hypothetical protein
LRGRARHRTAFRLIAIPGLVGIVLTGWGLLALDGWPTVFGATLVVLAQLWRIDRLVWMYEELGRHGGPLSSCGVSRSLPAAGETRSGR